MRRNPWSTPMTKTDVDRGTPLAPLGTPSCSKNYLTHPFGEGKSRTFSSVVEFVAFILAEEHKDPLIPSLVLWESWAASSLLRLRSHGEGLADAEKIDRYAHKNLDFSFGIAYFICA